MLYRCHVLAMAGRSFVCLSVCGDATLLHCVKTTHARSVSAPMSKARLLQRRHSNHYWNVRRSRRQTFQPCSNKR